MKYTFADVFLYNLSGPSECEVLGIYCVLEQSFVNGGGEILFHVGAWILYLEMDLEHYMHCMSFDISLYWNFAASVQLAEQALIIEKMAQISIMFIF